MKNTALLGAFLIAIAITHTGAFLLGRATNPPAPEAEPAPSVALCDAKTNTSKADRNKVWTVWNLVTARGNLETLDNSGPTMVGVGLAMLLDPNAPAKVRQNGLNSYFSKAQFSFTEDERKELMTTLTSGKPDERFKAVSRIVAADSASADLAKAVLADQVRMALFLAGKPITLE